VESVKEERKADQNNQEISIEEAFAKLDAISAKLEDRETSLEDSFLYYKQGMELLKLCSDKLDTVEKKMLKMNEDGTLSEFSRGINSENQ
jgi:exodeoxyribonuclease VII small subunit